MKKLLTIAAILAAFAIAQAPAAALAADVAPAAKTTDAKAPVKKMGTRLTKGEYAECRKEAKVEKDGKAPSKKEETTAYSACVKAKKDAKKGDAAPVKEEAPKTDEGGNK